MRIEDFLVVFETFIIFVMVIIALSMAWSAIKRKMLKRLGDVGKGSGTSP